MAAQVFSLDLPRQTTDSAVTAIASTMHITVGGMDPDACGRDAPSLKGDFTPAAALDAVLDHQRCAVTEIDAKTFRIDLRSTVVKPVSKHQVETETTVLVTARRRIEPLSAARADVTVVSGDSLGSDDRSLSAVARESPGMTVTNLGPGRDKIFLRGQSDGVLTGRTQSTVGLYLDDLPITFSAPDPNLELVDLKRVEVLQGPQGALYGQGSISGIVRLVTNSPDPSRLSGSVEASIGLGARSDLSSNLSGVLNLPLSKTAAVRLVAYRDEAAGFINDIGLHQDEVNQTTRYGGRASLLWTMSPLWRLNLAYASQEIASGNSQYVDGTHGHYTRALNLPEPHDNDFSDVSASVTGALPVGTLKISIGHLDHRIRSTYDATGLAIDIAHASEDIFRYDEYQHFRTLVAEATFVSRHHEHMEWLVGAFGAQGVEAFSPQLTDITGVSTVFAEHRHDQVQSLAAFGELTYYLTRAMTLTAGTRVSFVGHDTSSLHTLAGSRVELPESHLTATHLSAELSAQYRFSEGILLYAQIAEGYRDGGFNTTYLSVPVAPAQYQGDDLENFEIGTRFRGSGGRFNLSASMFATLWHNIQSDQFQASGLPITVNIGDGSVTGLEFEADYGLGQNVRLRAVGQLSDARVSDASANFSTEEAAGLPFIAPESVDLAADWTNRVGRVLVQSTADLAFRSVTHLNFGPFQNVTMDGYATLNMSSVVHLNHIDLGFRVDNATDVSGNSFAYGNPFTLKSKRQITPNRPRTFWLTVKRHF